MDDLRVAVTDIRQAKLEVRTALDFVTHPGFGGIASFIGCVRERNQGHVVTGISYDVFEPLALKVFREIGARALAEVGTPLKLYIAHAKGDLGIGDVAVLVAAGTVHRDEAFRACRLAVEAVKHEAPIWKQEHYVDGHSAWSEGCSLCGEPGETGAGAHGKVVHEHEH